MALPPRSPSPVPSFLTVDAADRAGAAAAAAAAFAAAASAVFDLEGRPLLVSITAGAAAAAVDEEAAAAYASE